MLMNGNDIVNIFGFAVIGLAAATILVEKGSDPPVLYISNSIRWLLKKLKLGFSVGVLDCTVCCAFWMSGFAELAWWMRKGMPETFVYWPFSGIIASAIAFFIIDFLNTLERKNS